MGPEPQALSLVDHKTPRTIFRLGKASAKANLFEFALADPVKETTPACPSLPQMPFSIETNPQILKGYASAI